MFGYVCLIHMQGSKYLVLQTRKLIGVLIGDTFVINIVVLTRKTSLGQYIYIYIYIYIYMCVCVCVCVCVNIEFYSK